MLRPRLCHVVSDFVHMWVHSMCMSSNSALYFFVRSRDSHFFLSHHYQIVARVLTTNLNSVNQTSYILLLIIFIIESQVMSKSSYYALKLLCNARQHFFFLQQRSWLVHRQLICDVRCLLMRLSLVFSKARRFRSSAFFFSTELAIELLVCILSFARWWFIFYFRKIDR